MLRWHLLFSRERCQRIFLLFFLEKRFPPLYYKNKTYKSTTGSTDFSCICCFLFMKVINTDFFSIILMSIINISVLSLIYFVVVWLLMPDILYLALAPDFYRISVHNNCSWVLTLLALNGSVKQRRCWLVEYWAYWLSRTAWDIEFCCIRSKFEHAIAK